MLTYINVWLNMGSSEKLSHLKKFLKLFFGKYMEIKKNMKKREKDKIN